MKQSLVEIEPFALHLASIRERVAGLTGRDGGGEAGGLLGRAFAELDTAIEELLVTEEELRVQNEMLGASRLALEAERQRYQDLFEFAPDGYLVTDMGGIIQEANEAAVALLGFQRRWPLIGKPLIVYVREDGRREFHRQLALLAKAGHQPHRGEQERNVWLRPRKGVPLNAAVTVAVVRDRNGRAAGLRWLVRDAARRQAEADQHRLLVEGTRDYAMILMDKEGCITGWNKGAERILKWTAPEMLGRAADFIFTPEDRESGVSARQLLEAASLGRATDLRWHPRADGSRFYADGILEALRDEDGGLRGFARILRDATEAKQAQDALQAAEDRLRDTSARLEAALSAGGIATFSWVLASDTVRADAELARLFSVSPEDAAGGRLGAYLKAIHPDDLASVNAAVAEAVAHGDVYAAEQRILLPNGATRRLEARGKVERDASGHAVSITGVVVDVTERVERERHARFLAELAERARALSDPDAVIADAVRSVGEFLGLSRCALADIDAEADTCTVPSDYCADETVASIAGAFPLSDFGPFLVAEFQEGRVAVVDDVRNDPALVAEGSVPAYDAFNIRAFIAAPVVHSSRTVSCLACHSAAPRHWEPEEVELVQAVVERTWLTVEVLRQQRALARESEAAARVLESITDGFYALDAEWRFTYVNAQAERMLSRTREELLGRNIWGAFPESVGGTFYQVYQRAMSEKVAVTVQDYYAPLDSWMDVRAYPSAGGLSVFFQNVTARVGRERRARFLAELAERARALPDPEEVVADAVRSVGGFLGVSRCLFADIDIEADVCTVSPDHRADDSVTSMAGAFPISGFGPFLVGEYAAGRTVAVDDVRAAPMRIPADFLGAYEGVACRAFIAAPVPHSDRLVSVIAVHSVTPRCWEPEEIELVQAVVERTWLTVKVLRQQRALAREAEAMGRVLESITDAFYAFDGEWRFTHVNAHAERLLCRPRANLLGRVVWDEFPEATGTKPYVEYRRAAAEQVAVSFEEFYVPLGTWFEVRAYPSPDGLSVFFQDITARKEAEAERERTLEEQRARAEREVLVSRIGRAVLGTPDPDAIQECAVALLGEALGADRCDFSSWDAPVMEALFAGGTAVIPDVRSSGLPGVVIAALEGSALRSVLAVPFFGGDGRAGAALVLAMADAPRLWTSEEVAAVETVAVLTRAAVEAARAARRERTVADQLTRALQPETPASAPGLALADFYRPAWEDQGVGGDFSDVFSGGEGVTFLVVGDLTGKGLAAASQVATVRQMLRFALLNPAPSPGRRVAGPVTALNGTLADHGLISGFATLFVGRYDARARALSYVNCGQDAGLVLRAATGAVEELPQTGPVLGTF